MKSVILTWTPINGITTLFSTKTPMALPLRQCCFYCAAVPPSGRRLHCNSRTAGWILATLKNTNYCGLNLPKLLGRPNSQYDCTWRQGLWGGGAGYMRSCRWVSNPTGLMPFKRRRHQQTSTLGSQSPRAGHTEARQLTAGQSESLHQDVHQQAACS